MGWLGQAGMVLSAALVGVGVLLQAGINSELSRALGHPLWAVTVSLLVAVAVTLPALLFVRLPAPGLAAAAAAPGWVWTGGALGAVYLIVTLLLAPRLGAAGMIAAIVAGQMLASLVFDQYALAGFPPRSVNLWRLGGAALVVAGVLVMQMGPRE
jgi:transporter family-2 protein